MQFPATYVHTQYAAVQQCAGTPEQCCRRQAGWNLVLQIISLAYLQLSRHSRFDNLSYESR